MLQSWKKTTFYENQLIHPSRILYNKLPKHIKTIQDMNKFKKEVKSLIHKICLYSTQEYLQEQVKIAHVIYSNKKYKFSTILSLPLS
jgi:hypothetical protein